jgi:hypothetical protein
VGFQRRTRRTVDDEARVLSAADRRHDEDACAVELVLQLGLRHQDDRLVEVGRAGERRPAEAYGEEEGGSVAHGHLL